MNFWFSYIKGYVRIKLTGIAPERFLNLCHNRGYRIWNIQCEKGCYTCCMLLPELWQIRPLARKTCTRVRIASRHGLPFRLKRHWKRKGAILGITLFFALLYLMSDYLWAIDIEGNTRYTDDTLLQFIYSTGITHGMKHDAIACEELEKAIRSQYNDITWVSARIDGTRLVVQVKENDTSLSEVVKDDTPADLVSDAEGIVRSIITRAGTPVARVGDEIHQGDVLISGLITIYNDYGEPAFWHQTRADGDIILEYSTYYEKEIPRTYSRRVYYQESSRPFVVFGSWHIQGLPFFSAGDRSYDRVEESHQLCIYDNFYLPVYFGTISRRYYQMEEVRYTDEELTRKAEYAIQRDMTDLENLGVEIIQNNVTITLQENSCICQGELLLWKSVGEYRDLSSEYEM